jgi:adenosylcobinamide kinase / adenosylcobinamide-phosphate guanylyltransferase
MKQITLITGGGRSGKSSFALALARHYAKKAFIATAEPIDDEMRKRIDQHKRDRGPSFYTIEEPLNLTAALQSLPCGIEIAVIDCVSVWIGNCMHHGEVKNDSTIKGFIEQLKNPPCDLIIVTNEVGMGIIPDNEQSRRYRDILGSLNQQIAKVARQVIVMVCGIPVYVKKKKIIKNNFSPGEDT